MESHTLKQKQNESDNDFAYRQIINNSLNLVRHYLHKRGISGSVRHIKDAQFEIEYFNTFQVPSGDGGHFTDTETCSIDKHTWYNYGEVLDWVLEQEKHYILES